MTTGTETIVRTPIRERAAWMGAELAKSDEWLIPLTADHNHELRGFISEVKARGLRLEDIGRDTLPLRNLAPVVEQLEAEIEGGLGFCVLRGFDLDGLSPEEAGIAYFTLGAAMGRPIRQNARGDLLGHVRDTGRDIMTDPNARGYQTRIALPFHTDTSTDLLSLLCYRRAKSGGKSGLVSLVTVYNRLLETSPELIDTLYERFHYDCREEVHVDGFPWYSRAAASVCGGKLSLRHNSGYAHTAQRIPECPRITEAQAKVMEQIDLITLDKEVRFDTQLEEGDMLWANNYQVAHARSEFEDHDEPELKRHLMRLWLYFYEGRPLAPDFDNRDTILTSEGPTETDADPK